MADFRPRYGHPTIYECQFEVASAIGDDSRIKVCGYVQRGPGECPYPHSTADGEPVALTALLTQPYAALPSSETSARALPGAQP